MQLDSKAIEVFLKWCPWAQRMYEQSVRQETHPFLQSGPLPILRSGQYVDQSMKFLQHPD